MAIKLLAVNTCSRSAHTRPTLTTRSAVVNCASLALAAAARSRATLSKGVSPGGPGVRGGRGTFGLLTARVGALLGFAEACGVVGVKRVASIAERGIVEVLILKRTVEHQEIFDDCTNKG